MNNLVGTEKITKTLYMPSTPLNVLVSSALAVQKSKQKPKTEIAELWLIDQKNSENNPYAVALNNWQMSPFEKVQVFSGKSHGQAKLAHRKQLFNKLKTELLRFEPANSLESMANIEPNSVSVAVGSDRRVEFQFVMHRLNRVHTNARVTGVYLDDGLYSYAGRPYSFIKDGVNSLLKKAAYGFWWHEPKTVGASSWIDQAWLFSPDQAVELLKQKSINQLRPEWFTTPEILSLSHLVAQTLQYDPANLAQLDIVMLIPHPNNIKKMPGYEKRIQQLVKSLSDQGQRLGVKYHPRTDVQDALQLQSFGAQEIMPGQMAFEFCLPFFNTECQVVGDVGTALLTCKWLRPDLNVTAVLDEKDTFQKRFISITQSMDINVTNQLEDIVKC